MATWLKQSTAVDIGLGPFVDQTDGFTPETGLTISQADVRLKKNGGNWAQKNQASNATHEENGWYEVNLDTTDTNTLGIMICAVYESGALPVWREFLVVPANVYDSYLSNDLLQVDLTQISGAAVSTSTAQLGANMVSTATGAITANSFVSGAITAAVLATDAVDEIVDAVWDELLTGANHNVNNSAGKRLRQLSSEIVIDGTAASGTANTITLDGTASAVNGTYDPALIRIVSGTGAGQCRLITQYTGATKVAAVDRDWRTNPDATSVYEILSFANLVSLNEGLATGGGASTITLNADASSINDVYAGQNICIRTGTGQDQTRLITAYVGATKVATLATPWTVVPDTTSGYMVMPFGRSAVVWMANDIITSAQLAASAITEIQTGLSTLDAAGVRSAVGLASANLDTQLDALPTGVENADALLKRDLTAVTGEASRSVLNAIRFLRNKWSVAAGTLTVTKEDDTTTAWSSTLTVDPTADPVTGSDPT